MEPLHKKLLIGAGAIILLGIVVAFSYTKQGTTTPQDVAIEPPVATSTATTTASEVPPAKKPITKKPVTSAKETGGVISGIALGAHWEAQGITVTPKSIVSDYRCPLNVQCIQAGKVHVNVTLSNGTKELTRVFYSGESFTFDMVSITLVAVNPQRLTTAAIAPGDYRFVFAAQKLEAKYSMSSASDIRATFPFPGAIVKKQAQITGEAKREWFNEGAFPIFVLDKYGNNIAAASAQATKEWRVNGFVPFSANLILNTPYTGPASIVLRHGTNADTLLSIPVTIE